MDEAELLKSAVERGIDKYTEELNTLSQAIWSKPELNFEEHSAHQVLTEFLEKNGFKVEKKYKLETAFKATFGKDDPTKPHIAVLCEYDALPEIGHACGHNLIAEVGIATGLGIQAAMKASNIPLGKLTVLGTPAEEGGGGKVDLIRANAFDDIDIAIMAHPAPFNQADPPLMAIERVNIEFRGKASHAAGFPWEGINALDAAVLCYQNISCLRQQMKPTWRVHGIIIKGGTKANIIPDFTKMQYYIRAPTQRELKTLTEKIVKCFNSSAAATGCTVDIQFEDKRYEDLISNKTLVKIYKKHGLEAGLKFTDIAASTGSTDMGNVSHIVPSIQPVFYVGGDVATHTKEFAAVSGSPKAQPYTLTQAKILALTALDIYTNRSLYHHTKQDFILDKQTI